MGLQERLYECWETAGYMIGSGVADRTAEFIEAEVKLALAQADGERQVEEQSEAEKTTERHCPECGLTASLCECPPWRGNTAIEAEKKAAVDLAYRTASEMILGIEQRIGVAAHPEWIRVRLREVANKFRVWSGFKVTPLPEVKMDRCNAGLQERVEAVMNNAKEHSYFWSGTLAAAVTAAEAEVKLRDEHLAFEKEAAVDLTLMRAKEATEAEIKLVEERCNNLDLDCTDAACPAWWRGNDSGVNSLCEIITSILDGKYTDGGVCLETWESVRKRLLGLVEEKQVEKQAAVNAACATALAAEKERVLAIAERWSFEKGGTLHMNGIIKTLYPVDQMLISRF